MIGGSVVGSAGASSATSIGTVSAERLHAWIAAGSTHDPLGAYCGWRRADGSLSEPYPEITGYALTYWCWAAERGLLTTEAPDVRAEAAADWLSARFAAGEFAGRPQACGDLVYYFDLAMGAHGLFNWARLHGSERHQDAAHAAVEQILLAWCNRTYVQIPAVDRLPWQDEKAREKWSLTGTAHLIKVCQALLMAEEHGNTQAGALAGELIAGAVREIHEGEGSLRTSPAGSKSLHAVAYAAEGLWCWSQRHSDRETRAASAQLSEWLLGLMRTDGTMPGFVNDTGSVTQPQSDVLAQTLRLARLHHLSEPHCELLEAAVASSTGPAHPERACLVYWPSQTDGDENTWATFFGAQALALAKDPAAVTWRSMV